MEFVEQRSESDKDNRPQFRIDRTTAVEPQRPVYEGRKNEILRDVSELADDSMPETDSRR